MSSITGKHGKFRSFLLLGAPGSGKGTQGQILGTIPRFIHFSIGESFRSLDTRTEIGRQFVEYSSRGELVPDELTVRFWHTQIEAKVETHAYKPEIDFLFLDGIPRNVRQAELMSEFVDIQQVFHLSCPDRQELARRLRKRALKHNRLDDASEEVIQRRIRHYEEETKPILDYYGADRVTNLDASKQPAEVLAEFLQALSTLPCWQQYLNNRV